MAIFSAQQIFSDKQAITADAASTNILDLGATGTPHGGAAALTRDIGKGNPIPFACQVTTAFATCTSVTFALEVDDNDSFSSAKVVASETVLLAALIPGKQVNFDYVPRGADERYVRMNYTVNGSDATAGNVTAGITLGNQSNVM